MGGRHTAQGPHPTLPPELADQGRPWTTLAAGSITLALAVAFAVWTFLSLRSGLETSALVAAGIDTGADDTVAVVLATVQWLLCIPHLIAGGLLLARAPSAIGASAFVLGAYGVVALVLAGGPILAGSPGPNSGWGVLAAVGNLIALGLVLHPRTCRDHDVAQLRRQWVRARR